MEKEKSINVFISKIEFDKIEFPEENNELTTKLEYDYSSDYADDLKHSAKVIIKAYFKFIPDVLMRGKVTFEVNIGGETELDNIVIEEIVKSLEARIANDISYLTTICGDMICGNKMIIPPIIQMIR